MQYGRENPIKILMAEDDPDDRFLIREEFKEKNVKHHFFIVNDGVELLDFLHQRGNFNKFNAPRPEIILLDAIMPKMDGRETYKEIKSYKKFNDIPIVLLVSSKIEEDYFKKYSSDLEINQFISKPVTYEAILDSFSKEYHH